MKLKLFKNFKSNKIRTAWLVIFFGFLFAIVTNGVPYIYSDGFGSYHTTQCLINEFSWACEEKPAYYPDYSAHSVGITNDKYSTVYVPGSALINLPGQIIANLINSETDPNSDFYIATNGHTLESGIAFLITASTISFLSLLLIYKSLTNFGYSKNISFISTIFSYASSYAIWYALLNHAYNHTYEIFALSLILYGFSRLKIDKLTYLNSVILGIGTGLAVISRPTLGVIILPIVLYLLISKNYTKLLAYILVGIPFALIYFSYNYVSYGNFIASGYSELFNQTFEFDEFNGHNILFSQFRGWFIYSPIFLITILWGIWQIFKVIKNAYKSRKYKISLREFVIITAILVTLSNVIIYGFWPIWWSGGSYGQRFMISFVPLMAFLLADFIAFVSTNWNDNYKKQAVYLSLSILVVWSSVLTVLYRFTPVAELVPKNESVGEMMSGDRYTVNDIFDYHFELIRSSESSSDYGSNLLNSASGGTNFIPLYLNISNHVIRFNQTENGFDLLLISEENAQANLVEKIELILHIKNESQIIKSSIATSELFNGANFITESNEFENLQVEFEILNTDIIKSLSVDDYIGFKVNNEVDAYFKYEEDLFFKGENIRLPLGTREFVLIED